MAAALAEARLYLLVREVLSRSRVAGESPAVARWRRGARACSTGSCFAIFDGSIISTRARR